MESDLLALHWMEHASVFSKAIGNLRTKTSYTDATLACEGHFYPVHKFVLSTCSQYFNAIFEWTPCINPVVVINNVTNKELEALLDFMYTGEVSVKDSLIPDIMQAAECLKIRGLSLHDDDGAKSKNKTDSVEPARKRRRTSASKRKASTRASHRTKSTSQASQSKHNITAAPPVCVSSHQFNKDETLNHTEKHTPEPDCTPKHQAKTHPIESQSYDIDVTHVSPQNNAPSTFMQTLMSPSTILNLQSKTSPPHVSAQSYSSAPDLSSHELIPDVSVNSVVNIKSEKMELEETKLDVPHPHAHGSVSTGEIPDFIDSLVDMRPHNDTRRDPVEEAAILNPVEPNENLYEFTEDFSSASAPAATATATAPPTPAPAPAPASASASVSVPAPAPAPTAAASHQEPKHRKDPATSSSSKKSKQDSTPGSPTFKCTFCGKLFKKKDGLTRHLRIHSKEPYTCKLCPFSATSYKASVDHRKKEHGDLHKCTLCDFTCPRYDNLRRHMSSHEKIHKCAQCKFSTARPDNLEKHVKRKHEKK